MSAPTLLLSDLHLPAAPSPLRETFRSFLRGPARESKAVYILGDLFEHWIGDDLGLVDYADEAQELRALHNGGVALYFMRGNRDFLVGKAFSAATGVTLLPDPVQIRLAGVATLLSHGDLYCTADVAYQRWRRFAHNRRVQQIFLRLPAKLRRRIAGAARGRSESDKQSKPVSIMDVDPGAIDAAFRRYDVDCIIHGHTHRPDLHQLEVDARIVERLVLADWHPGRCEYLRCDEDRIERVCLR